MIKKTLIFPLLLTILFIFQSRELSALVPSQSCIAIYYDKVDENYQFGEVYATFLQNLLGHFPEFLQVITPIEDYQSGDIERCQSTIYLGSYFENKIPKAFFDDFLTTKKHVAWAGYNIWNYSQDDQLKLFGHTYSHLTTLDQENLDPDGLPSFYKFVDYKGETFDKFSKWVETKSGRVFAAPFEQVALIPDSQFQTNIEVLATARHSATQKQLPYIIRNKNKFFIADIPFSYAHESDRYLVFADLLFDILNVPPRHQKPLAVVRIEDVHPLTSIKDLYLLEQVFKQENIPLHISLVPIFYDPLQRYSTNASQEFVPMVRHQPFMSWLKRAKGDGAQFIWHGVTHQYKKMANPHSGISSDDFEFWNAIENKPIQEDSVSFVLRRMELGKLYLDQAQIYPQVWLTPHYQASALDYYMFAQLFSWNIGRVIYYLNEMQGLDNLPFAQGNGIIHLPGKEGQSFRENHFKDLRVSTKGNWFGQLFPYEIYGDVYGQRLIPEILGNPQPFTSDHVWYPRSLKQILSDAKRNLVLRDCWASLFFHPYLLTDLVNDGIGEYPGDTRPLTHLLREIKEMGYQFVSLEKFIKETEHIKNVKRSRRGEK